MEEEEAVKEDAHDDENERERALCSAILQRSCETLVGAAAVSLQIDIGQPHRERGGIAAGQVFLWLAGF